MCENVASGAVPAAGVPLSWVVVCSCWAGAAAVASVWANVIAGQTAKNRASAASTRPRTRLDREVRPASADGCASMALPVTQMLLGDKRAGVVI